MSIANIRYFSVTSEADYNATLEAAITETHVAYGLQNPLPARATDVKNDMSANEPPPGSVVDLWLITETKGRMLAGALFTYDPASDKTAYFKAGGTTDEPTVVYDHHD